MPLLILYYQIDFVLQCSWLNPMSYSGLLCNLIIYQFVWSFLVWPNYCHFRVEGRSEWHDKNVNTLIVTTLMVTLAFIPTDTKYLVQPTCPTGQRYSVLKTSSSSWVPVFYRKYRYWPKSCLSLALPFSFESFKLYGPVLSSGNWAK